MNKEQQKRHENFTSLFWHFFMYIISNTILFLINYFFTPENWWFPLILSGWGIGLLWHLFSITPVNKMFKTLFQPENPDDFREVNH